MGARRTPLYGRHESAGARFTDFGGWSMPVTFDSIRVEHEAVRTDVGRFDVSHMGKVAVEGPDATELVQRLTTNDVTELAPGDAQYAAITDDSGIILDDTIVFRPPSPEGDASYLFVPNAGNNEAMADRWVEHRDAWSLEATVTDRTEELAIVAIQGPAAASTLAEETAADLDDVGRFELVEATVAGADALVARTGYTGEDGFELVVDWGDATHVWDALACQACGLGARDTLRLEAGLLLGGHEFDPEANPRTPLEAGIGFAVDLDTDFVGRDALAAIAEAGPSQRLVGIGMVDRGIPRQGYDVLDRSGAEVGVVTSGTQSPTLGRPIGLGYVDAEHAETGTDLAVRIRDVAKRAKVEPLPFVS